MNQEMNQDERRMYLIERLLSEQSKYGAMKIPTEIEEQKQFLRSLMNIRLPSMMDEAFLTIQDAYLQQVNVEKGMITLVDMEEMQPNIYLWKGDITRLGVDAIVNAANSGMTGCYQPCHHCIDNCIHTYAGIQLRWKCAEIMERQGHEEPIGQAKITPGYNLPCQYVIHTVGPIVQGNLTKKHEQQLVSCYQHCLELAEQYNIKSIAFCCISTGVFLFPHKKAAQIAVQTVKAYQERTGSSMNIVFNVFQEEDEEIYRNILGKKAVD